MERFNTKIFNGEKKRMKRIEYELTKKGVQVTEYKLVRYAKWEKQKVYIEHKSGEKK